MALADGSTAWLYVLAAGYEGPEEMGGMAEAFPTIDEFAARVNHGKGVSRSR